jgi:hypothetical protein
LLLAPLAYARDLGPALAYRFAEREELKH